MLDKFSYDSAPSPCSLILKNILSFVLFRYILYCNNTVHFINLFNARVKGSSLFSQSLFIYSSNLHGHPSHKTWLGQLKTGYKQPIFLKKSVLNILKNHKVHKRLDIDNGSILRSHWSPGIPRTDVICLEELLENK